MDHYGYIEWIEKLGSRYLPVEDRRTMKNEWRTSKNGWNLCEIPHGKRYGNVSEAPRLRFSSRKQFFQANSKEREKCLRGWTPSFFISSPIYSKIGEVVAAQLAQSSSARPGEPGCFLQKQQPSGGIFWRAQVGLGAICTPIFTKYTPLCCFLVILFS